MNVARVWARHHDELVRYLTRLCGDADIAADAAQEAFIRLVERPPSRRNVRAWLYQVGTNQVRDRARVRSRRTELTLGAHEHLGNFGGERPDEALEAAERKALVRAALNRLSVRDRTALLMREEGFSHREIADIAGTTVKSVGTIIARALEKLAQELTPDQEELE